MTLDIDTIERLDDLEEYKGLWKNIWFHKDGSSLMGNSSFPSEQAALDHFVFTVKKAEEFENIEGHRWMFIKPAPSSWPEEKRRVLNFTHVIPVPVSA